MKNLLVFFLDGGFKKSEKVGTLFERKGMKKILLLCLCLFTLIGCSYKEYTEDDVEAILENGFYNQYHLNVSVDQLHCSSYKKTFSCYYEVESSNPFFHYASTISLDEKWSEQHYFDSIQTSYDKYLKMVQLTQDNNSILMDIISDEFKQFLYISGDDHVLLIALEKDLLQSSVQEELDEWGKEIMTQLDLNEIKFIIVENLDLISNNIQLIYMGQGEFQGISLLSIYKKSPYFQKKIIKNSDISSLFF